MILKKIFIQSLSIKNYILPIGIITIFIPAVVCIHSQYDETKVIIVWNEASWFASTVFRNVKAWDCNRWKSPICWCRFKTCFIIKIFHWTGSNKLILGPTGSGPWFPSDNINLLNVSSVHAWNEPLKFIIISYSSPVG